MRQSAVPISFWLRAVLALGLTGVLATGCEGCRGTVTNRNVGEVRIVYSNAAGEQVSGDNGRYDFGAIAMGTTGTLKLTVQNAGLGTITLQSFSKRSGSPVKVGSFVDDAAPIFEVGFTQPVSLGAGDSIDFDLTFSPPVDPTVTQSTFETDVVMTSADTAVGRENAVITLAGIGISGECALPDRLDFGAVARTGSRTLSLDFLNPRVLETHGFVGEVQSEQGAGLFVLSPESPRGEFLLPAMRTKSLSVTFKPTEARVYQATLPLRRADGCPVKQVRLVGVGVDQVLTWAPTTLNFGYAPPQVFREGTITFSNQSLDAVTLTNVVPVETNTTLTVFQVIETASADLTTLTVPAGARDTNDAIVPGTATLKVRFSPLVLGPRDGFLQAHTTLDTQELISVPLRGVGGGPDIELNPSPLVNFGRIAYFPTANPLAFGSRKITVQNVGTRPMPADPQANLKLGKPSGPGSYGPPYWEVSAAAGSDVSEICVGAFDTLTNTCLGTLPATGAGAYDVVQGIEAGVAGVLDIPIRITPRGIGPREFTLKIFSNDADEAESVVTIHAEAVDVPPCDIEIIPPALHFGVVAPPSIRDLGFSIRNRKLTPGQFCLLTNLELAPESGTPVGFPAVFRLPADFRATPTSLNEYELQPGESKQIIVRDWPQGQLPPVPAQVSGSVSFTAADPLGPLKSVALTTTIATACLTISPNALDFGTVKQGCNSPSRAFELYNACSTNITINGGSLGSAAGEGPGGANCPGTAPCPEFFQVSGVAPGTVLSPGTTTPATFALKYHPINLGIDSGAYVLNVTQGGQPVDYVVPLTERGDSEGLNTDTFRQDTRPKADILLVIDDSGSMGDKQTALAANLNAFVDYAVRNNVDFQIGVTNTELNGATATSAGVLHATGNGTRILTSGMQNLSTEFADLVNVGLTGSVESCMAPATKALTAPYITDTTKNAGFLRADAFLAVVCVTDARDQAPQPEVFYLSQLLNIKGSQRASLFSYNVIGPFLPTAPPNCVYDDPNDGRHAFMVAQTNGVKEEICTPDWSSALQRIGKAAFGYRTRFYLTARPDLASATPIAVAIDGVTIPQQDPNPDLMTTVWAYDTATNSINFQPLYVPEPGKTLTVTYVAACIP